jgi:DNA-binding transcriptional regulator YiaG
VTAHPNGSRRSPSPARNPDPGAIRDAREAAGLSQTAAAALIYSTMRTWQDWEAGVARMHPGLFELFRFKTRSA